MASQAGHGALEEGGGYNLEAYYAECPEGSAQAVYGGADEHLIRGEHHRYILRQAEAYNAACHANHGAHTGGQLQAAGEAVEAPGAEVVADNRLQSGRYAQNKSDD